MVYENPSCAQKTSSSFVGGHIPDVCDGFIRRFAQEVQARNPLDLLFMVVVVWLLYTTSARLGQLVASLHQAQVFSGTY